MTGAAFAALLSAICWVESGHKTSAVSVHDGGSPSYGQCQVKLETARLMGFRGRVTELWFNPVVNRTYAARYLRWQLERYEGRVDYAVAAYNAGSVRGGKIKNQRYIKAVFKALGEKR